MSTQTKSKHSSKRDALVDAAVTVMNRSGIQGMTLASVAAVMGFTISTVTYYFRKKEDLIATCFLDAFDRLNAMIGQAASLPSAPERVRRFIELYVDLQFRIVAGEARPLALFNEIPSLESPQQETVRGAFAVMFRRLRGIIDEPRSTHWTRRELNARATLLLEQVLWAVTWLDRYEAEDAPRVSARMFDVICHGIAQRDQWQPVAADSLLALPQAQRSAEFLIATTRLINARGYHGTSVERISSSLSVTKGSFYHYNDAKDELVIACFERSYQVMRALQLAALAGTGSKYEVLRLVMASLVAYQLSAEGPLLRSSAYSLLPEELGRRVYAQSERVTDRFAGMISDGIAEGSIRTIDPSIGAQMINAAINPVADLPRVAPTISSLEAIDLYVKPTLLGLWAR